MKIKIYFAIVAVSSIVGISKNIKEDTSISYLVSSNIEALSSGGDCTGDSYTNPNIAKGFMMVDYKRANGTVYKRCCEHEGASPYDECDYTKQENCK